MTYNIPYFGISHIGRCRRTNEDNYICEGRYRETDGKTGAEAVEFSGCLLSEKPALIGLFDGMGGEECGEQAALLAAREASKALMGGDIEEKLLDLCRRANERICRFADQNGVQTMGTTAALLAFDEEGAALCNIGDSKIFCLSGRRWEQLSLDHVCAAPLGVKPPLSQNLGIPPSEMVIDPYAARRGFRDGDIYLICSDGLTDMVEGQEIARILGEIPADVKEGRLLETAAHQLLELALDHGGRDNITIILCGTLRKTDS